MRPVYVVQQVTTQGRKMSDQALMDSHSTRIPALRRWAEPLPVKETATYVADMVLELRNLAKGADLTSLQSFLELAYYEAFSAAHRIEVPAGELEHLQELGQDARRAGV
jgi:hypothetical protein